MIIEKNREPNKIFRCTLFEIDNEKEIFRIKNTLQQHLGV